MRKIALFIALFLLLSAPAAHADIFGLSIEDSFNTLVFGNFSGTSDTEGRLAVGGDTYLSGYSVGDKLPYDQSATVLVVGGDLTYTSGRVYGKALVGGSATLGHANVADGGVYTNQAMPFDFGAVQQRITAASSRLSVRKPTGTVANNWGGLTLTGNGDSNTQIFNVSGDELLASWGLSLSNIGDGATVIINVSGEVTGLTNMNMEGLASLNDKVLFNFYEATDLTLSGIAVRGSILAPLADVTGNSGVIWGTTIASSFEGGMQQNHVPFTGTTPIPAAAWLLGSGLLGLAGFRKKRQS
ncbi:MAG: choice-of-anchor A family protein [Proteobacteria bacterium]|nr:choice-of-anchor A family protein [Pseudomonadota bacterium]MBU1611353.1 choice-of-anchor A family protein [Pseudomonadota bacterium]